MSLHKWPARVRTFDAAPGRVRFQHQSIDRDLRHGQKIIFRPQRAAIDS
jgi:hypothetical protein